MTAGITAGCLPSLKPLLTSLLNALAYLNPSRRNSAPAQPPEQRDRRFPDFIVLSKPKHTYARHENWGADHSTLKLNLPLDLANDLELGPPQLPVWQDAHCRTTHRRMPSNLSGFTKLSAPPSNFSLRDISTLLSRARTRSRGTLDIDNDLGNFRSGYAVSITSGESGRDNDDVRTIWCVGSEEDCGWKDEELGMGIMRTTTTEVLVENVDGWC
ncbi:hypothetical protein P154DRAFT_532517 [Amniculicola lignicola CBS 123094]|uniref:Uncharacterized protein n=1 Tax=Amniculicola lignicola CBS 123094 TaxID=1392246 RepID=A0A6A5WLZ7_9PLEO|nr:hypothetical protein P154DRAFT_532517 [Amniculicola lignicola CBS 123094]